MEFVEDVVERLVAMILCAAAKVAWKGWRRESGNTDNRRQPASDQA
jgi:hypothetical protein